MFKNEPNLNTFMDTLARILSEKHNCEVTITIKPKKKEAVEAS